MSDARRRYRRATIFLLGMILAGSAAGIATPAGLGWDFANFYDAGRRVAAGQASDLYRASARIQGEAPQGKMSFWGAPISAFLYVPLSEFRPVVAAVLFKLEATLACYLALLLLWWHMRRFVDSDATEQWRFAAWFAFLCLMWQPFWSIYRVGGQTTPTVFLLLIGAMVFHTRLRFGGSALLISLAVLIKPALITALALLLLVSGRRFALFVAMDLGIAGLTSLATMGWSLHEQFLGKMWAGLSLAKGWPSNSSLYVVFDNLRIWATPTSSTGTFLLDALPIALKIGVVATFVALFAQSRRDSWDREARAQFAFLMALSFFSLISSILWEHYLAFLFPLLIWVVARRRAFDRGALVLVGTIFVCGLSQNLIFINLAVSHFDFESIPALLAAGLVKSAPLGLSWVLIWHYRGALLQSHAGLT